MDRSLLRLPLPLPQLAQPLTFDRKHPHSHRPSLQNGQGLLCPFYRRINRGSERCLLKVAEDRAESGGSKMEMGKASKFKGGERSRRPPWLTLDRPGFESQPHHLLTLVKFLKLPEPQFSNLCNGTNDSIHLVVLLCGFGEIARLLLLLFPVPPSAGV